MQDSTPNTVRYSTWGRTSRVGPLGDRAMRYEYETPIQAVTRSIERRTRLHICAGPRPEGIALDNRGKPESAHWAFTLGRRLPRRIGGGFEPIAEVWVAIPIMACEEV